MEENLFEVFPFSLPDEVSGRKTLKEIEKVTAIKENSPQLNICRTTKVRRPELLRDYSREWQRTCPLSLDILS